MSNNAKALADAIDAALVEIKVLGIENALFKRAMAYEAYNMEILLVDESFPAIGRKYVEEQVERMRNVARGNLELAYAGEHAMALDVAYQRMLQEDNSIKE